MLDSRPKQRLHWMDILRGAAIVLVVFWHAVSLVELEGLSVPSWLISLNHFFLPFRMPTLMFLSGMLLQSSLRKPLAAYLMGKIRYLVWPYLIWASVYMLVFGSEYPLYHPMSWIGTGHLWFLFFLVAYYVSALIVKPMPVLILPILMILASIPIDAINDGIVKKFLYFGAFFFIGHAVSSYRPLFDRVLSSRVMPWAVLVSAGFGAFASVNNVEYKGQYALLNLIGIFSAIWLAMKIEKFANLSILRYVGRNSIVFYVSHMPVMGMMLALASILGVDSVPLLVIAGFVLALFVGWALSYCRRSWVGRWPFEMPTTRKSARVRVDRLKKVNS